MPRETVLILVRNHYIGRLWIWMSDFGIIVFLAAIAWAYDYSGLIGPLKTYFYGDKFMKISDISYVLTVLAIVASFLLRIMSRPGRLAKNADRAALSQNDGLPIELTEVERRAILMMDDLSRSETRAWYMAAAPGFVGIGFFIVGGSLLSMVVYVAIACVTLLIQRPSLEMADELVESFIRKRTAPFAQNPPA